MAKSAWEQKIAPGVETYVCQPADPALRGPRDFPITGCDQAMPKIHARITIHYKLTEQSEESRRSIVTSLKTGLEKLASQLPHLTATAAVDPVSKRGTLKTIGNDDGVLFLVTGATTVRTDLPSYAELERERFGPWKLPKGATYPDGLINPVASIEGHQIGLPGCIFQLNFIDGGIILTACFHHYVADGPSVNKIFHAWGAHCRGLPIVDLFTDRTILINPEPAPQSEVQELERKMTAHGCMVDSTKADPNNPWSNMMGPPVKTSIVSFHLDKVAALKDEVAAKRSARVSTHDCFQAILWWGLVRAKCALGEDEGIETSWSVFPVSFRSNNNPGFPKNYIGNGTLFNGAEVPIATLKASEGPLDAAVALRRVIQNVNATFVEDAKAWLSTIQEPATRTWMTSPPRKMDAGVTSWACLDYHTWDIGFGPGTCVRQPVSPIPFLFPMPGKVDNDGEKILEAGIAVSEKVHELLMQDKEFSQYVKDYYVQP
ncbi:hypothetical protein PFICI_07934 [Pestalotiopsis fici W106-1]|uniref:Trichothecene 3-O-acetyltransferase n=1 Tax=Pestalotiopsis fici (strain W106-1 / CGMCC3.15140) TaxID=1229662 RepID=W3X2V6_PESFW|nr:uncharacterized protein PFICI_07934 [Pestalotiopsis fici W106-1]ETS80405.1 hypothetical protein PFICI_07934 [Pestalotiopsis fici W106-1]